MPAAVNSAAASWEIDNLIVYSEGSTGLNEVEKNMLLVHPNPATSHFNFTADQGGNLVVLNLAGQKVLHRKISAGPNRISTDLLQKGMYVLQFIGDDAKTRTGKVMIR